MNAKTSDITQKIKDGSYFADARQWYLSTYLRPISDRSFLLICLLAIAASCLIIYQSYRTFSNESTQQPIVIYTDHGPLEFPHIKPLARNGLNVQESVAHYLISHYVKRRESYDRSLSQQDEFSYLIKYIKNASTPNVSRDFLWYMSKTNPYSPFATYGGHTKRSIEVTSISFLQHDISSGKVRLRFTATLKPSGKPATTTQWEGTIHYRLSDIEMIAKTGAPLRFVITNYTMLPLNSTLQNKTSQAIQTTSFLSHKNAIVFCLDNSYILS